MARRLVPTDGYVIASIPVYISPGRHSLLVHYVWVYREPREDGGGPQRVQSLSTDGGVGRNVNLTPGLYTAPE